MQNQESSTMQRFSHWLKKSLFVKLGSIGFLVLLTILIIAKYVQGFFGNVSVLMGIVVGFVVSLAFGKVGFCLL